jgi:hypothetical protein
MADADELCAQLPGREGVEYGGRPRDGAAYVCGARLGRRRCAPSDTFLIRNQHCRSVGALDRIADIERMRGDAGTRISGYALLAGQRMEDTEVRL